MTLIKYRDVYGDVILINPDHIIGAVITPTGHIPSSGAEKYYPFRAKVQCSGHIDIFIGGDTEAALEKAVTYGNAP